MNAASHVPSGVLISTLVSVTCCCAARSLPAAATIPAATVVTKSRRVSSSFSIVIVLPAGRYYPDAARAPASPVSLGALRDEDRYAGDNEYKILATSLIAV